MAWAAWTRRASASSISDAVTFWKRWAVLSRPSSRKACFSGAMVLTRRARAAPQILVKMAEVSGRLMFAGSTMAPAALRIFVPRPERIASRHRPGRESQGFAARRCAGRRRHPRSRRANLAVRRAGRRGRADRSGRWRTAATRHRAPCAPSGRRRRHGRMRRAAIAAPGRNLVSARRSPDQAAGMRMEPPASVPTCSGPKPAAAAAAAPAEEPPGVCAVFQGLRVMPLSGQSPGAFPAIFRGGGFTDDDGAGGAQSGDQRGVSCGGRWVGELCCRGGSAGRRCR